MSDPVRFTLIGGATALIEFSGVRFLTDPTFDPAGSEFRSGSYVLERITGPALAAEAVLPVNAVLLSHDHHFDNLDRSGRESLRRAEHVITTQAGAERLGGNAIGLAPWASCSVGQVVVTATPARHGPADGDRGPAIGFVLTDSTAGDNTTYISGDTVWYEGVVESRIAFPDQLCGFVHGRRSRRSPSHAYRRGRNKGRKRTGGWKAFERAGLEARLLWGQPGVRLDLPRT